MTHPEIHRIKYVYLNSKKYKQKRPQKAQKVLWSWKFLSQRAKIFSEVDQQTKPGSKRFRKYWTNSLADRGPNHGHDSLENIELTRNGPWITEPEFWANVFSNWFYIFFSKRGGIYFDSIYFQVRWKLFSQPSWIVFAFFNLRTMKILNEWRWIQAAWLKKLQWNSQND